MGLFMETCPLCLVVQFHSLGLCTGCRQKILERSLIFRDLTFGVFSLLHYNGQIKQIIRQAKGGKNKKIPYALAKLLTLNLLNQMIMPKDGVLIPAPPKVIGNKDHAALLAECFGELLSLPVSHGFFKRVETEVEQKKKTSALRFQTKIMIHNNYNEVLESKNIILVDDIITTGATMLKMKKHFPNKNVIGLTLVNTANRF